MRKTPERPGKSAKNLGLRPAGAITTGYAVGDTPAVPLGVVMSAGRDAGEHNRLDKRVEAMQTVADQVKEVLGWLECQKGVVYVDQKAVAENTLKLQEVMEAIKKIVSV